VKVVLKRIEVKKKTNVLWWISATDDEVAATGATRIDRQDGGPLTSTPDRWPTSEASHGLGEGEAVGTDQDPLEAPMGQVDPMLRSGHPCWIKGAVVVTLWKVSVLQDVDALAKQVADGILGRVATGGGLLGGVEKLANDVIDAIIHGIGLGTVPMYPSISLELDGDNTCGSKLSDLVTGQSKGSWTATDDNHLTRVATVTGKGGEWVVTLTAERSCPK
jgi:hypothetical protein